MIYPALWLASESRVQVPPSFLLGVTTKISNFSLCRFPSKTLFQVSHAILILIFLLQKKRNSSPFQIGTPICSLLQDCDCVTNSVADCLLQSSTDSTSSNCIEDFIPSESCDFDFDFSVAKEEELLSLSDRNSYLFASSRLWLRDQQCCWLSFAILHRFK